MRFVDLFMAFPPLIMVMAIVATFGNEIHFVIFAISFSIVPDSTRIIRASALQVRRIPYIDAAISLGFGHARIILRHMLPNVMASYLIIFTSAVGGAILAEAALSFLGLGVNEPTPAWGLMLQGGTEESMTGVYWTAVFPGVAITLAVLDFSSGETLCGTCSTKIASGVMWIAVRWFVFLSPGMQVPVAPEKR